MSIATAEISRQEPKNGMVQNGWANGSRLYPREKTITVGAGPRACPDSGTHRGAPLRTGCYPELNHSRKTISKSGLVEDLDNGVPGTPGEFEMAMVALSPLFTGVARECLGKPKQDRKRERGFEGLFLPLVPQPGAFLFSLLLFLPLLSPFVPDGPDSQSQERDHHNQRTVEKFHLQVLLVGERISPAPGFLFFEDDSSREA